MFSHKDFKNLTYPLKKEFYQLADANFRKIGDVRFVSNAGSVDLILRTGTDQLIRYKNKSV